jgi:hypothetical protein
MKKIFILGFALCMFPFLASLGQNAEQDVVKSAKKDQSMLFNDVYFSYGIGTIYLFTSEVNHNYDLYDTYYANDRTEINSPGTFMLGYNRMLNKVIMIGFVASYMNCSYKKTFYDYGSSSNIGSATFNDNLLSGIAKFTFNYVNKPIVRVYSSVGMGITVDLSKAQKDLPGSVEESARKILFAGQITFMGVRFGRAFGGFCEFGFGTNSIITAGFNYQFGD